MNMNDYGYSYVNAMGSALRQPAFKLISNVAVAANNQRPWESSAWKITKIAFHSLIAVVFIIPAAICWIAGRTISYLSKSQIDYESLHLAPPPPDIPRGTDRSIDIHILNRLHNEMFTDQNRRDSMARLCRLVQDQDMKLDPDNPRLSLFYQQISRNLREIIKKIQSGDLPEHQVRKILIELADASSRCYPTWLEVSGKIYAEVCELQSVETKILRLVQDYKERVILEFCQNEADAQWHALSYVRKILGEEIGLDYNLSKDDPYAGENDPVFGKNLARWLFLQRYENVNRLVLGILAEINSREFDDSYYDFPVEILTQRGIDDPAVYVQTHFFDDDNNLKAEGVNLLLRTLTIIK